MSDLRMRRKIWMSRVAKTSRPAAQLAVDAARLVARGADDMQAAERGHAFFQFDVRSSAAMLVAMVIAPFLPASAMISASLAWFLALGSYVRVCFA